MKHFFQAGLLVAALLSTASVTMAGTKVTVGQSAAKRVGLDHVDHSAWDALLKKYCDASGQVNYAAWKSSVTDVAALDQYLAVLSAGQTEAESSQDAKLAFWINAYNAVTVAGILREYPTTSIRNHAARAFGYNIFHDLLLIVGEQTYSLDAIEHQILRNMGENRIHFAIVPASAAGPRLRMEAYTPQSVQSQLADNARDFFAQSQNFRLDPTRRTFHVSRIFEWFGEDFGATTQLALAGLARYLPDDASRELAASQQFSVEFVDFDWSLNDQATNRTARR